MPGKSQRVAPMAVGIQQHIQMRLFTSVQSRFKGTDLGRCGCPQFDVLSCLYCDRTNIIHVRNKRLVFTKRIDRHKNHLKQ